MGEVRIRIIGQIDKNWSEWLSNMTISYSPTGETILTGSVRDQSALYGLVLKLSNLGLRLISVSLSGAEDRYNGDDRKINIPQNNLMEG